MQHWSMNSHECALRVYGIAMLCRHSHCLLQADRQQMASQRKVPQPLRLKFLPTALTCAYISDQVRALLHGP